MHMQHYCALKGTVATSLRCFQPRVRYYPRRCTAMNGLWVKEQCNLWFEFLFPFHYHRSGGLGEANPRMTINFTIGPAFAVFVTLYARLWFATSQIFICAGRERRNEAIHSLPCAHNMSTKLKCNTAGVLSVSCDGGTWVQHNVNFVRYNNCNCFSLYRNILFSFWS